MALQTSGPISLNDIHVEAGGTSGTQASLNDSDIRGLINKASGAQNSFSEYYGASAVTNLPTSGSTINGQAQLQEITVSDYISSGETLNVPSNLWVWSDSTSTAALTIDIPCTVINDGKIIGKGGGGGWGFTSPFYGYAGGPAINVTSSGVTITNSSGAYIAGGGGGGGSYSDYSNPSDAHAGGGGGAGGGDGGRGRINSTYYQPGTGGTLNATGGDGGNGFASAGQGGGSGGGGGGKYYGGGGGGRILPGVGGTAGGSGTGAGGSAGNAAPSTGTAVFSDAGGGGGWGAAGATGGGRFAGGAGGAAITGTARTLSNSGTIYGST